MTDEDARYYAKSMSDFQREIILLCSTKESWGYSRLAEKTNSNYAEVQSVGSFLQSANLARVGHVRHGSEFAGSAIFLNERGDQVRTIVARMRKRKK